MKVVRAPLFTLMVVGALVCASPSLAAEKRSSAGCRLALTAFGLAGALYVASLYVRQFQADTHERNELKAAHEELAGIETEQDRHDNARFQLYETGDPLPIFLLIHQLETRQALARGETAIGFGIGLDRAAVEKAIPGLRAPLNPHEVVRALAATTHGRVPLERANPHYPRTASSFLAGHNLQNATTRERLTVVAGIANAYGIPARLRVGWTQADAVPLAFAGTRNWVEFPTLGLCVDTELSPEPVPTTRYLSENIAYYLNDRGHVVATNGDAQAALTFENAARGYLRRALERHNGGVR